MAQFACERKLRNPPVRACNAGQAVAAKRVAATHVNNSVRGRRTQPVWQNASGSCGEGEQGVKVAPTAQPNAQVTRNQSAERDPTWQTPVEEVGPYNKGNKRRCRWGGYVEQWQTGSRQR